MKLTRLLAIVFCIITWGSFSSCKKEDVASDLNPTTPTNPTTPALTADALKDSALAYSKDIYLWYNQIPATFNAKSYVDLDAEMTTLRQYSIEPGFSTPVDRWSFAIKQTEWDNISSGIAGDFGLSVFFMAPGDLRVRSVEKASPAGKAGIRRSWRIIKVAGSTDITSSNADFLVSKIYNSNNSNFTFQKPDGTIVDISLTAAEYLENPIFVDSVYTIGSKKIGYLSYNSFLGDTAKTYSEFQRIFNRFASQNINDLIVDLRYNGGGYVTVQEKLANYLINTAGNGGVMMKQQYNDKYSRYTEVTNFRKLGNLNLSRIFFIVSNNTASASELVINNLKPYMDVKLIGSSKTYGKPVGYFNIPVGSEWYIFPVSFRTTNKNGEGSYFTGMTLDAQAGDGLDKDWGDLNESLLAATVNYIISGSARLGTTIYLENNEVKNANSILSQPFFKGAIDPRRIKH